MVQLKPPNNLVNKAYWYCGEEAAWKVIDDEALSHLSLSDIAGDMRFIFDLMVDGKRMFIANRDEDVESLLVKHGHKFPVINADRLLGFFKRSRTEEGLTDLLPAAIRTVEVMDATIVR